VIPLMPANGSLRVGQLLEVTGWGVVEENGETSGELLKARVPYVENATCNQPRSYDGAIRPGMMCAGFREGGIDSCQGDSGGPLVWRSLDGPVLVGVVSFGDGCARKLKYGVYTRVAEYRSWISEAIAADRN
jgi:secreted trypsin-like serine protease